MSGGGFILIINMAVAVLVAGAFLFMAAYDNKATAPRWLILSCVLAFSYVGLEFAVDLLPNAEFLVVATYMSLAFGMACLTVGLARTYNQPVPSLAIVVLLFFALATIMIHDGTPKLSLLPMFFYQLPYALLQVLAASVVMRSQRKRALDYGLLAVVLATSAHFLAKPLIALWIGSIGTTPSAYISTSYAIVSQTLSAIFFLAMGLMIIMVMMRDTLGVMMVKSETDPLSGVLNRRGFEERAAPLLHVYQGSQVPLSMILCDLDHFKSVNDTYGHGTGDLVIAGFARQLTLASAAGQIVGRVGGEEFAIIYPGANLPMARIYAEGLRGSFAALSIPGAPPGRTFTASFGVAELQKGETVHSLMARADTALYLAKTAGRDCVRIAPAVVENEQAQPRLVQNG
ncbi:GGDEF domain-containing protein [Tianweitania sp. BSSL-BM11]|uniref:diguanylate cyclase n=1 Tax=Tianweitania aestuarii TaxID=2814886 RepID=A0ABS5RYW4_9HYPH|nr:GGDEF domain-containing protein [Tianweitania aestuarii]MBS9722238.1 GGDEF domain-containing protein [Tianweitania aestuarii]